MSALCQKRTYAVQQFKLLFDHLVGGRITPGGKADPGALMAELFRMRN
jgi:hypothetical protein